MTADALAKVVLEIVMRGLLKALPQRVAEEVSKSTEPMLEQIGATALAVEKITGAVVGLITRNELEEQTARSMDSFAKMARLEMQKIVSGLRIQSDVEGFLWLSNERDGVKVALGFRPFQYHGTYDQARKYLENDAVTNRGSLWIARSRVNGVAPGTDDGAQFWTLAVKCGKDARVPNNERVTDG